MQPERPVQTTLAFHASRIVIDVGVLLAMAAMSLTFVSAPGGNRSALAADALPAVLLLLPIFAVTLIPDHTKPLHPALGWGSMVLALAALPYAFVKLLDARVLADTLGGSTGFGPVLLLIGCLITLAGVGIGIFRDLMGWPSGGTPQRRASYTTRREPGAVRSDATPGPKSQNTPDPTLGETTPMSEVKPSTEAPTRIIESSVSDGPEQAARRADPSTPAPESPPDPAQPEIVFPDTGAVAREADPGDDRDDGLLDTAERADAALTESLMSMFEAEDDPDDPDDED